MNQEERMRKRWLPKEKKQTDSVFNWMKAMPLIIGLIIVIILLLWLGLR